MKLSGSDQVFFLKAAPALELLAEKLMHKILDKRSIQVNPHNDTITIQKDSLDVSKLRSIGGEHLCYEMIKRLRLEPKLRELGFSQKQVNLAFGSIVGRLLHPGSERATFWWLQNRSGLGELLDFDFHESSLNRFYEISDRLLEKKQAIEDHLYQLEKELFQLEQTIVLYDLTNTFLEGTGKFNPKAKRGKSKEKRSETPLITLGLVLDRKGFPQKSAMYSGNIGEPSTLKDMICQLENKLGETVRKTVVLDAGISSADNLKWLEENGYRYIVVSRGDKRLFKSSDYQILRTSNSGIIKGKLDPQEDGTWKLYCHSSGKQKKEESIKTLFEERLVEDLAQANRSLKKKYGTKRYEKVLEKC